MKILIVDKFEADGIESLKQLGCEVAFEADTDKSQLPEAIKNHNPKILVVRSTKVSPKAIQAGQALSLIVRAGAGYDTIDVAEASRRGISVANCPGKNSVAVAEIAWGLILSCDRRIPDQTADLRAGKWNKKEYAKSKGLKGRTLGIVGIGQIGQEVASRGKAFGMEVVAWSRSLNANKAEQLGVGFCKELSELAKQADVVSINVAATAETKHLIDSAFIDDMKPNAFLINTSRGSVVDEDALAAAIESKGLRAGLDVFANEPGSGTGEFAEAIVELPGVYGSHHVGASTDQAQTAIANEAVRVIQAYMETGNVDNCVNVATRTPAAWLLTIRHLNQPGVLAHTFQIIGESKINVEEMQNVIYDGAEAACAKIQLDHELAEHDLAKIKSNTNILSLELTRLD